MAGKREIWINENGVETNSGECIEINTTPLTYRRDSRVYDFLRREDGKVIYVERA